MQAQLDITSASNPKIKWLQRLHKPAFRKAEAVIVIEGKKEITAAVQAGFRLEQLFVAPEIHTDPDTFPAHKTYTVSKEIFAKIAYRDNSDGLIAIANMPAPTLQDLVLKEVPLLLVIEAVEKPGNLGAIIRTADGVGADAVIICDERCDIWNTNVIRASVGTVFTTPTVTAPKEAVRAYLQKQRVAVFAAELTSQAVEYSQADFTKPTAIVVGAEHEGVSDFWLEQAQHVEIPMLGKNNSLNVSVATAVIAYEALRQRRNNTL